MQNKYGSALLPGEPRTQQNTEGNGKWYGLAQFKSPTAATA